MGDEIAPVKYIFCAGNFSPRPAYVKDGELLTSFWILTTLSLWYTSLNLTLMYQTVSLTAFLGHLNNALFLTPHFPIVSLLVSSFLSSISSSFPSRSALGSFLLLLSTDIQISCKTVCLCTHRISRGQAFADKLNTLLLTYAPRSACQCNTIHLTSAHDKLQLPKYSLLL